MLGPLEVYHDGGAPIALAGARLRGLIARLALAGGQPVSTGALAEAVWDQAPPADVANALQTLVSRARRALGEPAAVEQSAAGYRLAVAPDDVDALRFERLVAEGAVAEALALWRGPALADAGDFAEPFARRLEDLRLDATVALLTRELDAGRSAAARRRARGTGRAAPAAREAHRAADAGAGRDRPAGGRARRLRGAADPAGRRARHRPGCAAAGCAPGGAARRDRRCAGARRPCPHEPAGPAHQLRRPHGRSGAGGQGAGELPAGHAGRSRRCGQDAAGRRGRGRSARRGGGRAGRALAGRHLDGRARVGHRCRRRAAGGARRDRPAGIAPAGRRSRSWSRAATRGPGCSRGWPTPAPCSCSTTASISSTRARTWPTRCSPAARGCGSWRPAGSRSASPGSRCSPSRRWTRTPPSGCSPTARRRSDRISRSTTTPGRWSSGSCGGSTACRWRSSSPPPGCGRCRWPRSPPG